MGYRSNRRRDRRNRHSNRQDRRTYREDETPEQEMREEMTEGETPVVQPIAPKKKFRGEHPSKWYMGKSTGKRAPPLKVKEPAPEPEKKLSLKERVKNQAKIIGRGAKVLPQVVGKKAVNWGKEVYKEGQRKGQEQREIEAEAKRVYRERLKAQLKVEMTVAAERKAAADAKKIAAGQTGVRGMLVKAGQVGQNLQNFDPTGVKSMMGTQQRRTGGSLIWDGMPRSSQKQPLTYQNPILGGMTIRSPSEAEAQRQRQTKREAQKQKDSSRHKRGHRRKHSRRSRRSRHSRNSR